MHVECLLTCSRKKLWLEKANMQMSIYRSRPVSARFKYRAYINRYLQAAHWVSDRFLARFVHLDAVMASITSIHLPRSRSAVLQRTSARFSVDGCFQSWLLLKMLTMGQAVPEIPLSVGSKLELHVLLRAFCLCQISVYCPVHPRICPRMYMWAVYNRWTGLTGLEWWTGTVESAFTYQGCR